MIAFIIWQIAAMNINNNIIPLRSRQIMVANKPASNYSANNLPAKAYTCGKLRCLRVEDNRYIRDAKNVRPA